MPAKEAKPIDRERLYKDPVYRFEYLCDFAGFGQTDIDAIHGAAGAVAPLVPAIVDAVYEKLFSFEPTKAVFLKRNEGFKGDLPANMEDLTLQSEQIKFRKDFLAKYLVKLVTSPFDAGLVKYLDYVGKVHTSFSGKSSKINVEYVHVSALFTFLAGFLTEALMNAGLPHDVEVKTVSAFNKILWIQADFFTKWYVVEAQEFIKKKD